MLMVMGLALLFVSVVSLAWGMMPDVAGRLIRDRVFADMARESRPTLLGRLTELLLPLNRLLPTYWYVAHLANRLGVSGLRMHPMRFMVIQEIGALTGVLIYLVTPGMRPLNLVWLAGFVLAGAAMPYLWLRNRIQSRRRSVSRDLPEVVDLLNLCIDAGIDFMNSLARVIKEFRPCPTVEELGVVIQEVRVGKRRRDALKAFSDRLQTPEARSFSRTLRQADRMGTGLGEALQILSEDIRIQRYHWAERFAQQAPLKMLIPLLFSLASALLIVAGPILVRFLQGGFTAEQFSAQQARE